MLTWSLASLDSRLRRAGAALPQRLGWPTLLLALALAGVFALNSDGGFSKPTLGWNTAKNLAIAENLSPQHNFRLFTRLVPPLPGEGEEPRYEPYSRFPIGSFALIKVIISPFGDNLAAAVFAARAIMLAFFSAAALLAYHAIARIASNKWIALTATLVAFSSYQVLLHADRISNETMIGLFGVMLTFHGMTIFIQEGKFRQLLIKACAALLLDWHVYAVLAPFVLWGLGKDLAAAVRARRESSDARRGLLIAACSALAALVRSRYSRLGAATLLFGAALLAFNIMSEYDALNGETPITELPSIQSMAKRMSLSLDSQRNFPWGDYLTGQSYRIASASIPLALMEPQWLWAEIPPNTPPFGLVAAGALAAIASLAGLLFVRRQRILLGTLAVSGFCWMLLMRSQALVPVHVFEAIYWIGVPLTLVTLLLLAAIKIRGVRRLIPGAAALALLSLSLSAYEGMAVRPTPQIEAAQHQALLSDFENIRKAARGKTVVVAHTLAERRALYVGFTIDYFLAGSRIRYLHEGLPAEHDFVLISHHRDPSAPLVTPDNEVAFLYGPDNPEGLRRARLDSMLSSVSEEPDAQAVYNATAIDVYRGGASLVYVKIPCSDADFDINFPNRIFLHVFPDSIDDLPEWRREKGYENFAFIFLAQGVSSEDKCVASVPLPQYPIAGVRTGESEWGIRLWDAAFSFDVEPHKAAYARAASLEPDARAEFNVYLSDDQRTLTYTREPCVAADLAAPFFLHVFPDRADDLPQERRDIGYEVLDFDFRLNGAAFDGKCAGQVSLPEYAIAGIRTGQWIRGEDKLWDAAFLLETETYRAAYARAASREPNARAEFNVYLDEGQRTLTYTREPCDAADIAAPFFLHVVPDRVDDLPQERRDVGYDALDFDFRLNGAAFDGKCAGQVALPEYAIAGIRTGQWIRGEDELWDAAFSFDPEAHRAAYARAASQQPDARAEFNVHLDEEQRTLTYTREPCEAADIAAPFFLHVVPERAGDLPQGRREVGFDNLDFDFGLRGAMFDGKCAAQVPLPEYRIAAMRTGQWIPGEGNAWEAMIQPAR